MAPFQFILHTAYQTTAQGYFNAKNTSWSFRLTAPGSGKLFYQIVEELQLSFLSIVSPTLALKLYLTSSIQKVLLQVTLALNQIWIYIPTIHL